MSLSPFKSRNKKPYLIKALFFTSAFLSLGILNNGAIALVFGFVFSNMIGHPYLKNNGKVVSWLLKIAVIGLGFGISANAAFNTGKDGFALTIISIVFTLVLGYILGNSLKIHKPITHLISSGTAICGGSAIAAISPIIRASEKETSISLGVVFLLNSVALLIFPVIGMYFGLTQYQFGLWSAIAIHDTSSVVGAAHAYGNEALQVATTVKMTRVIWIVPLSIVSMFIFKGNKKVRIPWFILLFIGAILINSYLPIPETVGVSIVSAAKRILILTLFLIGAGISIDQVKTIGIRPLTFGVILWILISVSSLVLISLFY